MKGTISFHPVRMEIFDRLIEPLVAGETVNPEEYLEAALAHRETSWRALSKKARRCSGSA